MHSPSVELVYNKSLSIAFRKSFLFPVCSMASCFIGLEPAISKPLGIPALLSKTKHQRYEKEFLVDLNLFTNKKIVSLEGVLLRLAMENKISREEFLKYYIVIPKY